MNKYDRFLIRFIVAILITCIYTSCYTEKKAERQVIKATIKYPIKINKLISQLNPPVSGTTDSTGISKGNETSSSDTTVIHDTTNNTVYKYINHYTYRTDTIYRVKTQTIVDRALENALKVEVEALNDTIKKKDVTIESWKGKFNNEHDRRQRIQKWLWILVIYLAVKNVLRIIFPKWASFLKYLP